MSVPKDAEEMRMMFDAIDACLIWQTNLLGKIQTIYGLRPWWKALCGWVMTGNIRLTLKTLKAFPRAVSFSIRTRSWEGTLWI